MQYWFTMERDGNMGLHVGDHPLHVMQNRENLRQRTGLNTLHFMEQVHGNRVVCVDNTTKTPPQCDAMISNTKGLGLCVMVADCIPLLFYDALTQSIGVAHAGRAGSALHISTHTVRAMQENFNVNPAHLQVFMGPSIKACCYEVGLDVTQGLEHVMEQRQGRYFLDLRQSNKEELLRLGVLETHIMDEAPCTCCERGYFSYRRNNVTGRFVGVIGL